jgi:hypothetical protein
MLRRNASVWQYVTCRKFLLPGGLCETLCSSANSVLRFSDSEEFSFRWVVIKSASEPIVVNLPKDAWK